MYLSEQFLDKVGSDFSMESIRQAVRICSREFLNRYREMDWERDARALFFYEENGEVRPTAQFWELMDFWGFPHDSYMAFGDSLNDMEMIQEAAYGIVMGNGKDALKPYADLVIGPSNEPGIYHTLKELHMID